MARAARALALGLWGLRDRAVGPCPYTLLRTLFCTADPLYFHKRPPGLSAVWEAQGTWWEPGTPGLGQRAQPLEGQPLRGEADCLQVLQTAAVPPEGIEVVAALSAPRASDLELCPEAGHSC